jgi:hypothetical protein
MHCVIVPSGATICAAMRVQIAGLGAAVPEGAARPRSGRRRAWSSFTSRARQQRLVHAVLRLLLGGQDARRRGRTRLRDDGEANGDAAQAHGVPGR